MKNYIGMKYFHFIFLCLFFFSCSSVDKKLSDEVQHFLNDYTTQYLKLYTENNEAQWKSNIEIVEGDTTHAHAVQIASEKYARFTGSKEVIGKVRKYLEQKEKLPDLQVKQLEVILYQAANNPETVEETVKERIKAETLQTENLFGFQFRMNGKKVNTNDIDDALRSETDLDKRLAAWNASKEVGKGLKEGLVHLRGLRNKTVSALGYPDYFTYQVSEYGMTTEEMMQLNQQLIKDIWPLYRELHTYMRYELAKKYNQEVPDYIPAHWLPNRWAQDWSANIEVEGINLDSVLKTKGAPWITKQAESFYVSLGFPELPQVFWDKSSLYPYPADSSVKKNNHASAWHIDLQKDVRSLMSVEPNSEWWETANHELGHIYYYMMYSHPDIPPLLRGGANRAYHEAMGTLMGLAAVQKPFLENAGLIEKNTQTDEMKELLKSALNAVVFIPFSSGTMTGFEKSLYVDNLSKDQFNQKWWELVKKYQGVVPPTERGEEYCDAATKTHINDDAAQYYDYALSYAILYQMHQHICKNILKEDPHHCNYYGNKEVGQFIQGIMKPGASMDWRKMLKETTGDDINAKAMVEYFSPLMNWLKEQNKERKYTLGETP